MLYMGEGATWESAARTVWPPISFCLAAQPGRYARPNGMAAMRRDTLPERMNRIKFGTKRNDLPISGTMSGTARPKEEGRSMAWVYLVVAGILEVVWAFYMKKSEGFSLLTPTVITIVAMFASFGLLTISMKALPLGTAYTIWTGIGAVGAFVVGVAVLGESITPMRVLAAMLIVSGLVMMKLSSSH
jgi:quaternary ammonium compound-resistance protein SugE